MYVDNFLYFNLRNSKDFFTVSLYEAFFLPLYDIAGPLVEPMKLSRVFTMHNSGQSSLTLYLVGIGAGEREERGFAVLNYNREITIKPNQTKSIEISYVFIFLNN